LDAAHRTPCVHDHHRREADDRNAEEERLHGRTAGGHERGKGEHADDGPEAAPEVHGEVGVERRRGSGGVAESDPQERCAYRIPGRLPSLRLVSLSA
jgi:hypothetical protein